jgi:hypothetical protein
MRVLVRLPALAHLSTLARLTALVPAFLPAPTFAFMPALAFAPELTYLPAACTHTRPRTCAHGHARPLGHPRAHAPPLICPCPCLGHGGAQVLVALWFLSTLIPVRIPRYTVNMLM